MPPIPEEAHWTGSQARKAIIALVFVILGMVLVHHERYHYHFTGEILNIPAHKLWAYISDAKNMPTIYPNVKSVNVTNLIRNSTYIKYTVYYEEHLSQLHFLNHHSRGDYEARKIGHDEYSIYSTHRTCYMNDYYCVHTLSWIAIFQTESPMSAVYTESINFECPSMFKMFCYEEVTIQRNKMYEALNKHFETPPPLIIGGKLL